MGAAEWTASCHTGRGVPSGFSLADRLGRVCAGGGGSRVVSSCLGQLLLDSEAGCGRERPSEGEA